MIRIVAKSTVKQAFREKFFDIVEELAQKSNNEEGCFFYKLYEDVKDKNILTILEEWRDDIAVELHNNTEHFKSLLPQLREVTESVEVNVYKEASR